MADNSKPDAGKEQTEAGKAGTNATAPASVQSQPSMPTPATGPDTQKPAEQVNKDEGTSRVTPEPSTANKMMLDPNKNPTAQPGVMPSDSSAGTTTGPDGEAVRVPKDPNKLSAYRLERGKHRYQNPETGEWVLARAGADNDQDIVWLNSRQYDALSGRVGVTPVRELGTKDPFKPKNGNNSE